MSKLKLKHTWIMQHDKDFKHRSKSTSKWPKQKSQIRDLNDFKV